MPARCLPNACECSGVSEKLRRRPLRSILHARSNPRALQQICNKYVDVSDGNDLLLNGEIKSIESHDKLSHQDTSYDNSLTRGIPSAIPAIDSAQATMSSLTASTTATTTTSVSAISNNNYTAPTSPTIMNTSQQESEQQRVPYKPPANNRSILILREIEPTSSESSVRDLFKSENCPSKPIHCEYALQNSWYVTFSNDEDARLALAYIRKHIVNWKGKPIMARYKPKPAVPSAANQPPPHHHIMPPLVMQQQQQQRVHNEDNELVTDSTLLGGPVTSAGSAIASTVSSGHQSPVVSSPHAMINNTGATGGLTTPIQSPNDAQSAPLSNSTDLMTPYGHNDLYQATSLPAHHHHPDGSLVHHPHDHHHINGPHNLMTPQSNHAIHQQQLAAGYNLYYGQQGQIIQAPWDLSTVFVYNGLCPYNRTPSVNVSSVSLVGNAYHRGSNQQHIEIRAHHGGELEQNERKHRRRRRLE